MAADPAPVPTPREAFDMAAVSVGDVIRYPAVLRPEHGNSRGARLVVVEIVGQRLRCLSKRDGKKYESSVFPEQLRDNGVIVEGHVGGR